MQTPKQTNTVADPLDQFDDPVEQFEQAMRQVRERNPSLTRAKAAVAVARRNPKLHQAFLLATNPRRFQQRVLREKFDLFEE